MQSQKLFSVLFITLLATSSLAQETRHKANRNQTAVELFAPGTISTGIFERNAALSPDGSFIDYSSPGMGEGHGNNDLRRIHTRVIDSLKNHKNSKHQPLL